MKRSCIQLEISIHILNAKIQYSFFFEKVTNDELPFFVKLPVNLFQIFIVFDHHTPHNCQNYFKLTAKLYEGSCLQLSYFLTLCHSIYTICLPFFPLKSEATTFICLQEFGREYVLIQHYLVLSDKWTCEKLVSDIFCVFLVGKKILPLKHLLEHLYDGIVGIFPF